MNKRKMLNPQNQQRTYKQSEFARLVAEEGMPRSQAYRIAYNPNKNATKKSIHEMASRVFTNVKVQSRIMEVKCQINKENRMHAARREEYVLKRLIEEAEFAENAISRIKALELLGKTVSLFDKKIDEKKDNTIRRSNDVLEDLKNKLQNLIKT